MSRLVCLLNRLAWVSRGCAVRVPWPRLLSGVVLSLLGLMSCLGSQGFTPTRFYSINVASEAAPLALRTWPVMLGVRPFTAALRYRDRILYRVSDVEVGFYEYARWVEPPEEMVLRAVTERLRQARLFRQVTSADSVQLPAWILSAEVTRFDEVRGTSASQAECWLRLELRHARTEVLLWSGVLQASALLQAETPQGLAQAMSRAVQDVARDLVLQLQEASLSQASK